MFCFRASWTRSSQFDARSAPDWLCVESNWQGYCISTVPWVADVARSLGLLSPENTVEAWIEHLNSLGLREVQPISCEDFYESRLFS